MRPLDIFTLPLQGTHLIEASAGTGKTYAIATLVLRLILQRGLGLESILVVTFTRAATAELKHRIRLRVREALEALDDPRGCKDESLLRVLRPCDESLARQRLGRAIAATDESGVMTIHGFCQSVLREHAFESGAPFDVELVDDARPLLRELVADWWARAFSDVSVAQLDYLAEQRFTLAVAQELAWDAVAWPDMPVVGVSGEVPGSDEEVRRYHECRRKLAARWQSSREEVLRLLRQPGVLQGNRYRDTWVENWIRQLDALLTSPRECLDGWFEQFGKFTPASLQDGTKRGKVPPQHPFFEECAELLSARTAALQALGAWLELKKRELIAWARTEFGRRKGEQAIRTFDDLLRELAEALRGPRGPQLATRLAHRYPAALIDEFQDTDPVQYDIFRTVYRRAGTGLYLVGDPKQAVYAFRGADIFAYLRAVADTRGQQWTMDTNWRSDPGLVAAVNSVFGHAERPFLLDGIHFTPVSARPGAADSMQIGGARAVPFEVLFVSGEGEVGARGRLTKTDWASERLPALVASDIHRLLAAGATLAGRPVAAGDIAVLTRTNRQANDVQRALRRLGIPSVLAGDASVLASGEAHELLLVMRALAEPGHDSWLASALSSDALGIGAEEIASLRDDPLGWEVWVNRFAQWHEEWLSRGFMRAFLALSAELGVAQRLLSAVGGERSLTNWLHLGELLHQVASKDHLGMTGLVEWLETARRDDEVRQAVGRDAQQLRLESDASAVQLTTMHRSKGLEYPVVYCPYLWEQAVLVAEEARHLKYHDPADRQRLKLDLRPFGEKEGAIAAAQRELLAERLRLTYVALTRARHQCRVIWGLFTEVEGSPLAHLFHHGFRGRHGDSGPDKLDEPRMRRQLADLESRSQGTIRISNAELVLCTPLQAQRGSLEWSGPRLARRALSANWRTASFSSLAAGRGPDAVTGIASLIGRDRDESGRVRDRPTSFSGAAQGAANLLGFPRGARSGELLHAVMERVDFEAVNRLAEEPSGLDGIVIEQMRLHGFDGERWGETVCQCVRSVVSAALDDSGSIRLERVGRRQRLDELEFIVPVPSRGSTMLDAARLGRSFAGAATNATVKRYAALLSALEFVPLEGYLRGFIDLVFVLDGRWYLVDYKSNHLGEELDGYSQERLSAAMIEHHYILQYHLYVLALHRYLRLRIADYDYERHFGGVYYLFLRGLVPYQSPRFGVWYDRPPRDLIDGLVDEDACHLEPRGRL